MLYVVGAMPGTICRPDADVLSLFPSLVVTNSVALVVRVNDVPIARIRHNETAFATASGEPVPRFDDARISSAGDTDIRVVLLGSVEVLGKCVVDRDVIKLRGWLIVLCAPGLSAVNRNADTAVIGVANAIGIGRIDPQTVVIAMAGRQQSKRFSTVNGTKRTGV